MNNFYALSKDLPPAQQAIRDRSFHPSGTFIEFPIDEIETSIPARFEKIVRMYSDRIAIETGEERITYEALNQRANRLAHAILEDRNLGDSPISIILPLGILQIVSILATLKAGRMFLLLDPSILVKEIASILTNAQTRLILTNKSIKSRLSYLEQLQVRFLEINTTNDEGFYPNPKLSLSAQSGAYIKYTSGSTGRAKGVVISHRTVLHSIMNTTNTLHFCSEDREINVVGNTVNRSFLKHSLNGATYHLFDFSSQGIHRLPLWMEEHEITVFKSFPAAFRSFISFLPDKKYFPKVRMVRLGGEPVYRYDFELFKKHFSSNCVLTHAYGSSETAPICSFYLDHNTKVSNHRVPVGYPAMGKEISIVDADGTELSTDHIGEIVVTSRFLSSGYLQQRSENVASFHPLTSATEVQSYRTGDLGRVAADGCLTLFGRKDDRVKIRNFRVDLGEIEAKLSEHPEVKLVVVTSKKDSLGEDRLIAYFAHRNRTAPTVTALREFLLKSLPPHMVPAVFVPLAEMPLTPTGKIDRRALPAPSKSRPDQATPFVKPRTKTENILAEIWKEILRLDEIGIQDNFFDLGGHSLTATRILLRITKILQVDIPLNLFFDSPTVADLATFISQYRSKQPSVKSLAEIVSELEAMPEEEAKQTAPTVILRESPNAKQ